MTVVEPVNTLPKSEVQKRTVATGLWSTLLNVMVSCGQKQLQERCALLKALELTWRSGREISHMRYLGNDDDENDELAFDVDEVLELDVDDGLQEENVLSGVDVEARVHEENVLSGVDVEARVHEKNVLSGVDVEARVHEDNFLSGVDVEARVHEDKLLSGVDVEAHVQGENVIVGRPHLNFVKNIKRKGNSKGAGAMPSRRSCPTAGRDRPLSLVKVLL